MSDAEIVIQRREDGPALIADLDVGTVAMTSRAAPHRSTPAENEDAAGLLRAGSPGCVLAVADGVGGISGGGRASVLAVEVALASIRDGLENSGALGGHLVRAFDAANDAVLALGTGAETTLTLAVIEGRTVRVCNVGDSEALVTGQRGRVKFRSTNHSPVGYAVEAGLLDAAEALHHEERHVISNTVGSNSMSLDIGAPIKLAARDTLLLGSDGLFDNLMPEELVDLARVGAIERVIERLTDLARRRMDDPEKDQPSKPDDLAVIVFRPR